MSFLSRMYSEVGNALTDAYAHLVHGDDAGKSAKLIFVARPKSIVDADGQTTTKFDLGMTFLEVNDRAYVRTVVPDGGAARAGVQPRDCVQFAAVLAGPKLGGGAFKDDEASAAAFALECEKRGLRTNYDELRSMFVNCTVVVPDPADDDDDHDGHDGDGGPANHHHDGNSSAGMDEEGDAGDDSFADLDDERYDQSGHSGILSGGSATVGGATGPNGRPKKHPTFESPPTSPRTRSNVVRSSVRTAAQAAAGQCGPLNSSSGRVNVGEDGETVISPTSPDGTSALHPVVLVFRRTRQRQSLGYGTHIGIPSFRLDDECDRAATLIKRLAPTADTEPVPTAWDEMVHDSTEWLLPGGSILPPEEILMQSSMSMEVDANGVPSPTAAVSRLNGGSGGAAGGPATAGGGGGGSGPKSPSSKSALDESIPLDALEAKSSEKLSRVQKRMTAEALRRRSKAAGNNGGSGADDVEAATIRGMIQKAVGLAFIRTSKVVMGVSLHGGSGIVIARLPDGTWSAPSAIGTWGLGLGIQFGLEVADYIFILQTQDALEHFRRGGNFTLGGNIGAAVAGVGREAYGAASVGNVGVGACSSSQCNKSGGRQKGAFDDCTAAGDGDCDDDEGASVKSASPSSRRQQNKKKQQQHGNSNLSEIAPIVAYAKSQGLYFGVSLEGSRIFTREDINARTYKFATGRAVTAEEILSGTVATPPEAEELYASLHRVEFTHEISNLPRPPEVLRTDAQNDWRYDRTTPTVTDTMAEDGRRGGGGTASSSSPPFSFLENMTEVESVELSDFETKFKKFLYGGVSVQRLVPNAEPSSRGKTRRERRTLWLMLPEVGALRLGFISKLNDGGDHHSDSATTSGGGANNLSPSFRRQDSRTSAGGGRRRGDSSVYFDDDTFSEYSAAATEDMTALTMDDDLQTLDATVETLASSKVEQKDMNSQHIKPGKVHLSKKHCVALTDVTILSQEPNVSIRYNPDDATEHLRVISIQDVSGTSLLFLANNFREAELLVCGLKLLLERETSRLGVRGGVPITQLGGTAGSGAMSPAAARGFRNTDYRSNGVGGESLSPVKNHRHIPLRENELTSNASSEPEEDDVVGGPSGETSMRQKVPEGRTSWSQVPARNYLRNQAASPTEEQFVQPVTESSDGDMPIYVHGELLVRELAAHAELPLPLPLCRVLLLDSASPVISKWENDRGDTNYSKSQWKFPTSSPRDLERHDSEHQLIASGSMKGAQRTTSYDRMRNGELVSLSETQIVDADDSEKLAYTVSERMPRRGFSVKVRFLLRAVGTTSCEATVLGELRPMGKNMTNQVAVHKAFLLVVNEIKARYGTENKGLLSGFMNVVNNLPTPRESSSQIPTRSPQQSTHQQQLSSQPGQTNSRAQQQHVAANQPGSGSGLVSFEDVLKKKSTSGRDLGSKTSTGRDSRSRKTETGLDRPPTPSMDFINNNDPTAEAKQRLPASNDFAEFPGDEYIEPGQKPMTIEVKPLPKIRLDLMPAPREEDEDNDSSNPGAKRRSSRRARRSRR